MMVKLTKEEVEEACVAWLRGTGYTSCNERTTSSKRPVAVDLRQDIICKHTQVGAECVITSREYG